MNPRTNMPKNNTKKQHNPSRIRVNESGGLFWTGVPAVGVVKDEVGTVLAVL
jgi:hypothetical protein